MVESNNYYQLVNRYFEHRVKNREDARDLTQDVFLKMLQSKKSFENIKNFSGWMLTIAHNRLVDHYRTRKLEIAEIQDVAFEEEEQGFYSSLEKCLDAFLDCLAPEEKMLIEKVDFQGMSQKTMAIQLGLSYPTLRSKVQRARKKIYDRIADLCFLSYDSMGNPQDCIEKKKCDC